MKLEEADVADFARKGYDINKYTAHYIDNQKDIFTVEELKEHDTMLVEVCMYNIYIYICMCVCMCVCTVFWRGGPNPEN